MFFLIILLVLRYWGFSGIYTFPVLYILYVNDIERLPILTLLYHFSLYDDDTSIAVSNKTYYGLYNKSSVVICELVEWFGFYYLRMNPENTRLMRLHKRQKQCKPLILMSTT